MKGETPGLPVARNSFLAPKCREAETALASGTLRCPYLEIGHGNSQTATPSNLDLYTQARAALDVARVLLSGAERAEAPASSAMRLMTRIS